MASGPASSVHLPQAASSSQPPPPPEQPPVPSEGELFKRILGARWLELHPDIQARFAKNPAPGRPLLYRGVLSELSCSRWGALIAYLSRPLCAGALIPYSARDFPVDIRVYSLPDCWHIYKHRTYRLPGRPPIEFTSYMRESSRGEVLEYVGFGLGMRLALDVRGGNLHFASDGYFWELAGRRVRLPSWLTPGRTFLTHANVSPEEFRIRIEIHHPLLGHTFTQAGVFRELTAQ